MPELPEVEAWRRTLERWLAGRRVVGVVLPDPAVVRPKLSTRPSDGWHEAEAWVGTLAGASFDGTARVGKRLGLQLGGRWVLVHLGMTGRFMRGETPRFARLGLTLDQGPTVWFADMRRFGCWVPLPSRAALHEGLGPDALDTAPDGPTLAAAFPGRRAIKVALLDQARLAGLGNIHAAEALWRAGIHPEAPCGSIAPDAWAALADAVAIQLADAVATIPPGEDFVYVTEGGDASFAVYGREGESCPRCTTPVQRRVQAGRSTFWCPACQPQVTA